MDDLEKIDEMEDITHKKEGYYALKLNQIEELKKFVLTHKINQTYFYVNEEDLRFLILVETVWSMDEKPIAYNPIYYGRIYADNDLMVKETFEHYFAYEQELSAMQLMQIFKKGKLM